MADIDLEARIAELRDSGEAIGLLADDPEVFRAAVDAFRAVDPDRFQEILDRLGILDRCALVCRWLCSKHCLHICLKLSGAPEPTELDVEEWRAFAELSRRIAKDEDLLKALIDAVDREDVDAWKQLVARLDAARFRHQLCHWICLVRCRRVCRLMCPPKPLITNIGSIPTPTQVSPQGFGNGPGDPAANVPFPNPAAGVGDHPFGGTPDVRGVFNFPGATQYMVEISDNPAGPWDPVEVPVTGRNYIPFPPFVIPCTRNPSTGADHGWYEVNQICDSHGGPTDVGEKVLLALPTGSRPDGVYYLRLRVRAGMAERVSAPQVLRTDNTWPAQPTITLELQTDNGERKELKCGKVKKGDGLIAVTIQASDENFSSLSVAAQGNSGLSVPVVDVNAVPLSKTYNGNTADQGYPVATTFLWDPWSDRRIVPCCYVVRIDINDRALSSNMWAGGHSNSGWEAIEIGF